MLRSGRAVDPGPPLALVALVPVMPICALLRERSAVIRWKCSVAVDPLRFEVGARPRGGSASVVRSRCIRRVGGKPRRRVETVIKTVYFVDEFCGRWEDGLVLQLFSADDHIIEPADVWHDRVPASYRDVAPHVVEEDGREYWVYEDSAARRWASTPSSASAATSTTPTRSGSPTCGPAATTRRSGPRTCWPTGSSPASCSRRCPGSPARCSSTFKDKELADVCVRAYNDFVIDEWCPGGPPGMFVPTIISPAVGSRARGSRDPPLRRARGPGAVVPGEPGAARPAVVLDRPLGPGVAGVRGDRRRAVPAHRHQRRDPDARAPRRPTC